MHSSVHGSRPAFCMNANTDSDEMLLNHHGILQQASVNIQR